ncbi:MAG: hypothetical protein V2B19_19775 [Pseudomonadota bacterium]
MQRLQKIRMAMLCFSLFLFSEAYAATDDLVMIFSGDNLGAVEPGGCGCAPKKGGLARRASAIERIKRENKNVLVVDCGDLFSEKKTAPELRAETISKAMEIMKYDAINVGDNDFIFGVDFFKKMASANKLPFISSNIKIAGSPELISPYVIKKFDKFSVGITGIADPAFFKTAEATGKNISTGDARSYLNKALSEMKGKTDFVILLSHIGESASLKFIEQNDIGQVSIAVTGHTRGLTMEPIKVKNTFAMQNCLAGESIGILRITLNSNFVPESCRIENDPLSASVPDHPEIATMVKEFEIKSLSAAEQEIIRRQKQKEDEMVKETLHLSPEQFIEKMKKREDEKMKEMLNSADSASKK